MGKLSSLSVPQLLHLSNGDSSSPASCGSSKFYEVLAIASIKACEGGVGVIGHGAVRGSELREPP